MKENKQHVVISKATIDRLPLYYRTLKLSQEEGVAIISSEELGRRIGVTPEQIRKDLSAFGEFGKKGVGYYVSELIRNIGEILGLNRQWNIAIVGVGHLGWALANYANFASQGFQLQAIFDVDANKVGKYINDVEIFDCDRMPEIVAERDIQIGIITVPAEYAQSVANKLIKSGIKGIWNFTPVKIDVPERLHIVNEDLSVGLSSLSFHLSRSL
ncbi:MAG TPA: redox-sensing transcriptional repressor Rex [Methylomusa anaerophila]|uniref:Redox-sensing transcriptional repressor Rex n=1 Tax=Methylomusa anaerophila TaxID=1930071 RepID=A0A348AFC2_9FIRM|nr:redox-sensing transcriptional repressor Rex [Methylomusa anaerophila]BBB89770.1 redox-sensing transcriptional repressor Rex [Methylomusa anaerophila]HML89183.1 redox-sensing transcriptional repressor Rex [Methylomusa anaerophila]